MRDLKGRTISVTELGSGRHLFVSAAMAYVRLDPRKDVRFVSHGPDESIRLLAEGKIDAYQAFAEEVYELRARKIGRVILNSLRPLSAAFGSKVDQMSSGHRTLPSAPPWIGLGDDSSSPAYRAPRLRTGRSGTVWRRLLRATIYNPGVTREGRHERPR